jgi:hypothetical protein
MLVVGLVLMLVAPRAASGDAALCDAAAVAVAGEVGVPVELLRTLTRVETGRSLGGRFDPWPWTLNIAGRGHWYDSASAALADAERAVADGRRNIDLGCFQLNYRWHGGGFTSLGQMLDPRANALYAADFLRELYEEFGDWTVAVGAYHSRSPAHATRYLARYREIRAALAPQTGAGGEQAMATGPVAVSMAPRPSLFGREARPLIAVRARPLWEIP